MALVAAATDLMTKCLTVPAIIAVRQMISTLVHQLSDLRTGQLMRRQLQTSKGLSHRVSLLIHRLPRKTRQARRYLILRHYYGRYY